MRKLEIRGGKVIDGGLDTPKGFRLCCNESAGVLFSETFATTVFIAAENALSGRSVKIAKNIGGKNTARAIVLSNCGADVLQKGGRDRAVARVNYTSDRLGVPAFEVRPIFVGGVSARSDDGQALERIDDCVQQILRGERSDVSLLGVSTHTCAVQFYLGDDYLCTLCGTVFTDCDCPATKRTVLLTTDVSISAELLRAAMEAQYKESFGLLPVPPAPNDGFTALASGLAGNNTITARDVEYAKFSKALEYVLTELCGKALSNGNREDVVRLRVVGATSKRAAWDVVRNAYAYFLLSGSEGIALIRGITSCIGGIESVIRKNRLRVWLQSERGELLLLDAGKLLFVSEERAQEVFGGEETIMTVDFRDSNYGASGWIPKCNRKIFNS